MCASPEGTIDWPQRYRRLAAKPKMELTPKNRGGQGGPSGTPFFRNRCTVAPGGRECVAGWKGWCAPLTVRGMRYWSTRRRRGSCQVDLRSESVFSATLRLGARILPSSTRDLPRSPASATRVVQVLRMRRVGPGGGTHHLAQRRGGNRRECSRMEVFVAGESTFRIGLLRDPAPRRENPPSRDLPRTPASSRLRDEGDGGSPNAPGGAGGRNPQSRSEARRE